MWYDVVIFVCDMCGGFYYVFDWCVFDMSDIDMGVLG